MKMTSLTMRTVRTSVLCSVSEHTRGIDGDLNSRRHLRAQVRVRCGNECRSFDRASGFLSRSVLGCSHGNVVRHTPERQAPHRCFLVFGDDLDGTGLLADFLVASRHRYSCSRRPSRDGWGSHITSHHRCDKRMTRREAVGQHEAQGIVGEHRQSHACQFPTHRIHSSSLSASITNSQKDSFGSFDGISVLGT